MAAEKFFICGDCDHPFSESDAGGPVYECSTDGQPQVDERRCQQCNKFCAKVADMSCPECESYEDLAEVLQEAYEQACRREQQEKMEAAERAKKPRVETEWEKEHKVKAERQRERWSGEDSLGNALRDIPDPSGTAWSEDGSLGGRWEHFFQSGSTGTSIDVTEAEKLCEKILHLEEQLREWSGVEDG